MLINVLRSSELHQCIKNGASSVLSSLELQILVLILIFVEVTLLHAWKPPKKLQDVATSHSPCNASAHS